MVKAQFALGELLVTGSGEPAVPKQLKEGALLLAQVAQQTEEIAWRRWR